MTVHEMRKNVYGVPEIDDSFLKQIAELAFQQIKAISVGDANEA